MHSRRPRTDAAPTALVLVPERLNYFFHLHGRRLAEALRELGFVTDVATLPACPDRPYDWCVLTNVTELIYDHAYHGAAEVGEFVSPPQERDAVAALRLLARRWRAVAACSLDCVSPHWYRELKERCAVAGVETILNFGLHDQRAVLPAAWRPSYHFLVNGLTSSERRRLDEGEFADDRRALPWAFVGHLTSDRAALVDRLVAEVDPRGFVYAPRIGPRADKDSPHLGQRQYETVLRHARYQVWCSHQNGFYLESERFRLSLLAGSVPIKVMAAGRQPPAGVPFRYLLLDEDEVAQCLREFSFPALRRRFVNDFRALKGLKQSLGEYLLAAGLLAALPAEEESPTGDRAGVVRKAAG
jgi:hypothetical protein